MFESRGSFEMLVSQLATTTNKINLCSPFNFVPVGFFLPNACTLAPRLPPHYTALHPQGPHGMQSSIDKGSICVPASVSRAIENRKCNLCEEALLRLDTSFLHQATFRVLFVSHVLS